MQSVKNARQRMLQYPAALSKCSSQAAAYGKCVSTTENIKRSDCQKEFEALRACVRDAMKQGKKA